MYLPSFAYKHALFLYEKFSSLTANDIKKNFICGELASLNQEDEKEFFAQYDNYIFIYDIPLTERNIYFPATFLMGLYISYRIGFKQYRKYIKQGALFAILQRNNFYIEKSSIYYAGALVLVHARKKKEEKISFF